MSMKTLDGYITNLKNHDEVDAVFVTGSYGLKEQHQHSDLDLVIVLQENTHNIRSVFQWIDGVFSDIFFFDHADLERISKTDEFSGNSMDAIFLTWLSKAKIFFDKSGKLTELKNNVDNKKVSISTSEKDSVWQQINHNFINNTRYFHSNDPLYHEALEVRLQHSVVELLTGFVALNDMPWRGEKEAVQLIKERGSSFYAAYQTFLASADVTGRYNAYKEMFEHVAPPTYKPWLDTDVIVVPKDASISEADKRVQSEYWDRLRI